jgi:ribosomal protein S18 acetylase RimI-like enzyme
MATPADVDIRSAGASDVEAITALYIELKRHHARLQPDNPRYKVAEERWAQIAHASIENPEEAVLVAEAAGGVVGFVRLSFTARPWGKACEINTLVVGEASRGGGVGRALMVAAERTAAEGGAQGVRLDILVGNDDGARFYEELGYELFAWRYGKMLEP